MYTSVQSKSSSSPGPLAPLLQTMMQVIVNKECVCRLRCFTQIERPSSSGHVIFYGEAAAVALLAAAATARFQVVRESVVHRWKFSHSTEVEVLTYRAHSEFSTP